MSRWSAKRWLRGFRRVCGYAEPCPLGLNVGWFVRGRSDAEHDAARYLSGILFDHPLRYDAVRLQVAWSG